MIWDELDAVIALADDSDRWIDDNGNEHWLTDELSAVFDKHDDISDYNVDSTTAFESCGLTAGVISIAWVQQGELYTLNFEWRET